MNSPGRCQHIACLVKTSPASIAALWRTRPAIFQSHTIIVQPYEPDLLFVEVFARDAEELGRLMARLVGEHAVVDIDARPVLPPQ